jgi:predicted RNA-binding Zn-ribbon protein involved in translation (DUF1610 family)
MYCPFCEGTHSEERKDTRGSLKTCPECAAELSAGEHACALRCPYCDNYLIFEERIEAEYAPDGIIPFQYGRESVKRLLRDQFRRHLFAPADFLAEARLNSMEGTYVPFWLYDYAVNCRYRGEGARIRSWVAGETQYTETSIYEVYRDMDISYEKIPVDASLGMPDQVMDLLEPYQYGQMVGFLPEYLSGFQGETYSLLSGEAQPRAREKMEESARQLLRQSVSGYADVKNLFQEIRVDGQKESYGLLPVWSYRYQYRGRNYPFYINGQTGKIIGKVPVSPGKVWAYGLTLWAVLAAVLALLYGIAAG